MRSKIFVIAAAAVVASVSSLMAQTSGGSTYSVFNLGDMPLSTNAAGTGHAGIESSTPSPNGLNSVNPAAWADMRLVTLQAAFLFEQYQVSNSAESNYQNNSKLQQFAVGIPYSDSLGGTIGFALRPLSTVAYRTLTTRDVPNANSATTQAQLTTLGRGGITEGMLGTSLRPLKELTVGAAASLYFGSITSETDVTFPSASLNPAFYRTSDVYSGLGARIGVRVQPVEDLYIGAVMETGATLERERTLSTEYIDLSRSVKDTTSRTTEDITLPPRFTLGVSYHTGRWLLSGEGSLQNWNDESFATARPSLRAALGADRLASPSVNANGFERWTFRLGAFYDQTYYSLPGGDVNSMGVTLGAGVPLTTFTGLNAGTYLDFGAELGMRGTTNNGLTQELYGKLIIELAVSELWFVRTRN